MTPHQIARARLLHIKTPGLLSFGPAWRGCAFEPVNVLIGPNDAGKSNLIEALKILRAAARSPFSAFKRGHLRTLTWNQGETQDADGTLVHLTATLEVDEIPIKWTITLAETEEHTLGSTIVGDPVVTVDDRNASEEERTAIRAHIAATRTISQYRTDQHESRQHADSLASVLGNQTTADAFRKALDLIGERLEFKVHRRRLVPATPASPVLIRYIQVMATLLDPTPCAAIAIDVPEHSWHPDIVAALGRHLRDTAFQPTVIVATHSERLLDFMNSRPERVLTATKRDRRTEFAPLERDILKHLDAQSLSDLWASGRIGVVHDYKASEKVDNQKTKRPA